MEKLKILRKLSVRQWLALDAVGSFLIGCGIFWQTACLLDSEPERSFAGGFILILYLMPVCLALGLTALLLWGAMGEKGEKPSRLLTAFGAVPQILAGLLHFCFLGGFDILLDTFGALVLAAGIAGLLWAVYPRKKVP